MVGRKPTVAPSAIVNAVMHFKDELVYTAYDGVKSKYKILIAF